MLNKKIEKALNNQLKMEAEASNYYLSIASWAETIGMNGIAEFFFQQSEEERIHMLRLVRFINERGGKSIIPATEKPEDNFKSITNVFNVFLEHELAVTKMVNNVVDLCHKERDYPTLNFMQWYVSEQIEEEALVRTIIDKLKMIGEEKSGLYMFDRDLNTIKNPLITINNN